MFTFPRAIAQRTAAKTARTTLFRPTRIPHVATYYGHLYDDRPEQPPPLEVERVVTPCLYDVLNVPRDATKDQIKEQYRKLTWKYHPDVAGGQRNPEMFTIVTDAYNWLTDDSWRKRYDADLTLFEDTLNDGIKRIVQGVTQRAFDRISTQVTSLGGKLTMNDLMLAQRAIGDWLESNDVIQNATKEWMQRKYATVKGKEPRNPGMFAYPAEWANAFDNPFDGPLNMESILRNIFRRFDTGTWDNVTRSPAPITPLPSESWCRAIRMPEEDIRKFCALTAGMSDPEFLELVQEIWKANPNPTHLEAEGPDEHRKLRPGRRAKPLEEETEEGSVKEQVWFTAKAPTTVLLLMGLSGLVASSALWTGFNFVYKPLRARVKRAMEGTMVEDTMMNDVERIEQERCDESSSEMSSKLSSELSP